MKKIISYSFLLFSSCLYATADSLLLTLTINVKCKIFTTDNIGNIYVVNENEELIKYNASGKQLQIFSNKTLGKIHSVDVSNPLKIQIFFRDNLRIIYTDNMLNPTREEISLEKLGYFQTVLSAISYNNSTWIFDQQNMELIRLNEHLQRIVSTNNLSQLLNAEILPVGLLEYNSLLYMNCPSEGIMVFDIFGTYIKTLPLKSIESFQVFDEMLFFYAGQQLFSYNFKSLEQQQITIPKLEIISIRAGKGKIYISTGKEIKIYNYQ